MYLNGQMIFDDCHFLDHMAADVPIQIYRGTIHKDIGFIEYYGKEFVKVNSILYSRKQFTFISRPGY
ncbi:hypothetical protein H7B67_29485 [Cohnella thailandensis]|uniref:Uncharacterized protein n=2 Tax=Cohnella thailandensis TaxID=557557 RepID=A0A841T1K1_9BACL|nr:hypothetical protein [Cohnella thailandensis]